MKSVIKAIVLFLIALTVIFYGGAMILSPEARVERAMMMKASPDRIYATVGHLRHFNSWSPWAELDPKAVYTFEGPEEGVGQKMRWTSNDPAVGNGSQTVIEAEPNSRVVMEVDFGEMGKSLSTLTLTPAEGGTLVTWRFSAELTTVFDRWMGPFFDKWIGADYEKGLTKLKALSEAAADADKETGGG